MIYQALLEIIPRVRNFCLEVAWFGCHTDVAQNEPAYRQSSVGCGPEAKVGRELGKCSYCGARGCVGFRSCAGGVAQLCAANPFEFFSFPPWSERSPTVTRCWVTRFPVCLFHGRWPVSPKRQTPPRRIHRVACLGHWLCRLGLDSGPPGPLGSANHRRHCPCRIRRFVASHEVSWRFCTFGVRPSGTIRRYGICVGFSTLG